VSSHMTTKATWAALLVGAIATFAPAIHAAETEAKPPLTLSIQESVETALRNNPLVQIAREERNVARGRLTEATSAALPNLTASGTYTRLERVPSATFEGRTFTLGEQGQYLTSVNLVQSLYRAGATAAGIRSAKYYRTLADELLRGVEQAIAFNAEKAYDDVLLQAEFYQVSQDALKLTESHRSDVEKKLAQGFVSKYDLLRAKIAVSNTYAEMIQARNALRLARTTFLKILALPLDTDFVLSDKLAYKEAKAEMEQSLTVALLQRPEIKQADLKIAVQKETIKSTAAALYPTVSLVGTWEGGNASRFSFGGTDWDQGWYAGVMVSVPVFEGMRTRGRLVQEKAKLRQYDLERQDLFLTVELEVKQSILTLEDATEFVESQKENVRQAEEGLRLATVRYDQEMATQLDVLDARHALTQARRNYAQATYSHRVARLSLTKAMGVIQLPQP
jgi:outer membrane protein TolC